MIFDKLTNLGTAHQNFSVASKARMTNIVALFTIFISAFYTLNYIFILDEPVVAAINAGFTLAYCLTLAFTYFNEHKKAKLWFFTIVMVHLVVCTNVYVTNKTGFHLYYFLVPTGAYLLFELKDKFEKIALSIVSVLLFFYCENTFNTTPLIELTDDINHLLYQSVFFFNMVEVIFVLTLFANQIEANELKLTRQATTDSLTGVANRHHFFDQGNSLLSHANHDDRPFSLILLDFDYFKRINDQYGHFAGDLCLIEISKTISNLCREQDVFARIGGEEFVIALPDTTMQEANNIAETMRLAIEKHIIPIVGQTRFTCTASFGITSRTNSKDELKNLLIEADKALYFAKNQGRNRVQSYAQE